MNGERESRNHHIGNRLELLERIVERTALEDRLGDVGARSAQQDGVAVGTGAGDRGGAERTAAAALVLDHDGAEQRLDLLRPRAADGIEPAARRKRNHQPDRTIGIARLRECEMRRPRPRRHRRHAKREHITSPHRALRLRSFSGHTRVMHWQRPALQRMDGVARIVMTVACTYHSGRSSRRPKRCR